MLLWVSGRLGLVLPSRHSIPAPPWHSCIPCATHSHQWHLAQFNPSAMVISGRAAPLQGGPCAAGPAQCFSLAKSDPNGKLCFLMEILQRLPGSPTVGKTIEKDNDTGEHLVKHLTSADKTGTRWVYSQLLPSSSCFPSEVLCVGQTPGAEGRPHGVKKHNSRKRGTARPKASRSPARTEFFQAAFPNRQLLPWGGGINCVYMCQTFYLLL